MPLFIEWSVFMIVKNFKYSCACVKYCSLHCFGVSLYQFALQMMFFSFLVSFSVADPQKGIWLRVDSDE